MLICDRRWPQSFTSLGSSWFVQIVGKFEYWNGLMNIERDDNCDNKTFNNAYGYGKKGNWKRVLSSKIQVWQEETNVRLK